ncbi:MAG TPA: esterase-like activity of phytase family protein [Pirellulales bacterium]|nr:esterase-like activity of phytase family protein [Pirellulales bacterium]
MIGPFVVSVAAVVLLAAGAQAASPSPVELIGTGSIEGNLADQSRLTGKLEDGTPANRLGAWGSGIAYTGRDNLYVVISDRGPNASTYKPAVDNTTSYPARVQLLRITVKPPTHGVDAKLIETRLLTHEDGTALNGLSTEYAADQPSDFKGNRRIDPESIRVSCDGLRYYVSDEYGPGVFEFDAGSGRRTRTFSLPPRFAVPHPAATGAAEISGNDHGRQANHGLEGLAISPDGAKLVVILQAPLLQDAVEDGRGRRIGINVRLLTIDIASGETREYLYQLANGKNHGVSEIVAVNGHEFLVLERDAKAGKEAQCKSLFLIDIEGASDIGHIDALPRAATPADVRPAAKRLFLDLLDPALGLAGPRLPGKIEGLAFGPDLPDGRHLLLVTTDNDFEPRQPGRLFAFAIERSALPQYEAQHFVTPPAETTPAAASERTPPSNVPPAQSRRPATGR